MRVVHVDRLAKASSPSDVFLVFLVFLLFLNRL